MVVRSAHHQNSTPLNCDDVQVRPGTLPAIRSRYDAITSDHWVTRSENGRVKPRYCCRFFLSPDRNSYLYCTPFQNPRYTPFIPVEQFKRMREQEKMDYHNARQRSLSWHRRWEPSMDELVGLIMGYDIVFRLVDDQDIRDEVRRQVNNLGDYLAEHGYLLVRPGGGFTALGASGAIPAFEFPWQRVFERITGNRYEPRRVRGRMRQGGRVGLPGGTGRVGHGSGRCRGGRRVRDFHLAGRWYSRRGDRHTRSDHRYSPRDHSRSGVGHLEPQRLFRRVGVARIQKDELDETGKRKEPQKDTRAQDEFVLAYLLKKLPLVFRFRSYVDFLAKHKGGWTAQHPPYVALTGLGDADGTVRSAYLAFLPERRKHSLAWEAPWVEGGWHHECDMYAANPFASAVAVVLGGRRGRGTQPRAVAPSVVRPSRWPWTGLGTRGRGWRHRHGGVQARAAVHGRAGTELASRKAAQTGSPPPLRSDFRCHPRRRICSPSRDPAYGSRQGSRGGEVVLPEDTWGDAWLDAWKQVQAATSSTHRHRRQNRGTATARPEATRAEAAPARDHHYRQRGGLGRGYRGRTQSGGRIRYRSVGRNPGRRLGNRDKRTRRLEKHRLRSQIPGPRMARRPSVRAHRQGGRERLLFSSDRDFRRTILTANYTSAPERSGSGYGRTTTFPVTAPSASPARLSPAV